MSVQCHIRLGKSALCNLSLPSFVCCVCVCAVFVCGWVGGEKWISAGDEVSLAQHNSLERVEVSRF